MKVIRIAEDLHDDCNAKRIGVAQWATFRSAIRQAVDANQLTYYRGHRVS